MEEYRIQYTNEDGEIFDGGNYYSLTEAIETAKELYHSDPDCLYFVIYDEDDNIIFDERDL